MSFLSRNFGLYTGLIFITAISSATSSACFYVRARETRVNPVTREINLFATERKRDNTQISIFQYFPISVLFRTIFRSFIFRAIYRRARSSLGAEPRRAMIKVLAKLTSLCKVIHPIDISRFNAVQRTPAVKKGQGSVRECSVAAGLFLSMKLRNLRNGK